MSKQPSNFLQLNFAENAVKELLKGKQSATGWEGEIYSFLESWDTNLKTINVQTSGSTGEPKSIQLKKKYMKASAQVTLDFFRLRRGDSALLCLPLKYIAGKMMIVRAIVGGLNLYCIEPSLKPVFGSGNFAFAAMTPAQASGLLQSEKGIRSFDNIQKVIVGGSFIPESLELEIQKLETQIWHTYGMTETITHIALRKVNGDDASQWFKPLPGVELQLAKDGCLQIEAPGIGVHALKTNDLVAISNKDFRILGRKDNVVNSGGIKLFPEEIEKKLEGFIENSYFLTGIPDKKYGEILAFVFENKETSKKETELKKLFNKKLGRFEIPKKIIFVEKIYTTPNGKIIRELDRG